MRRVAFARTFDLPVTWFFMPPPPWASPGVPAKLQTPDAERFGAPLALLADLVFGTDEHAALLALRLQAFLEELGPNPLTDAQRRVTDAVETRKAQLVRHALGDLQGVEKVSASPHPPARRGAGLVESPRWSQLSEVSTSRISWARQRS